jgi:hypothetical protein
VSVPSISVHLKDPTTLEPMCLPARGEACAHTRSFDLFTYLRDNLASNKWSCPVCKARVLPASLFVDTLQLGLLQSLAVGGGAGASSGSGEGGLRETLCAAQSLGIAPVGEEWEASARARLAASLGTGGRVEFYPNGSWKALSGKRKRESDEGPAEGAGAGAGAAAAAATAPALPSSSAYKEEEEEEIPPWEKNPKWGEGAPAPLSSQQQQQQQQSAIPAIPDGSQRSHAVVFFDGEVVVFGAAGGTDLVIDLTRS